MYQPSGMNLGSYLRGVDDAVRYQDGASLASLLSLRECNSAKVNLLRNLPSDTERQIQRVLAAPWDELVYSHLKCAQNASAFKYVSAFRDQQLHIQTLVKILQSQKEENWCLPVMCCSCLEVRLLGVQADKQARQKKNYKQGELLEKSAESLMSCFRVCASDNRAALKDSKRLGMLHLVNQLFKIYYSVNTLHLCKPLVRAIEGCTYKDEFNLGDMVTYRYFVGRKAVFDNELKTAHDYLSFAFQNCHPQSLNNKRQILIYLLPVKLLLGFQPTDGLLEKYGLGQFIEICHAMKTGNVLKFQQELDKNESYFFKIGVYLILERLRMVVYRNLFKRVFLILGTHQIPIEALLAVLKSQNVEDINLAETQCLLANLVYQNKIKGYISLQHSKLVVSKQNAFPKLSSLN